MNNIEEIEELVKLISRLPGLGPKSAKRIVLKLINSRDELIKPMANSLAHVYKNVTRCNLCGSLKSNLHGCNNCENTNGRRVSANGHRKDAQPTRKKKRKKEASEKMFKSTHRID